jgi:hypothetical protein
MKIIITRNYEDKRRESYPLIEEQIDKLYHAVDSGLFGESAKNSEFYLALKQVKDDHPKPS